MDAQIPVHLAPEIFAFLIYVFRMIARINGYCCSNSVCLLHSVMGTGVLCVVETGLIYNVAIMDETLLFI